MVVLLLTLPPLFYLWWQITLFWWWAPTLPHYLYDLKLKTPTTYEVRVKGWISLLPLFLLQILSLCFVLFLYRLQLSANYLYDRYQLDQCLHYLSTDFLTPSPPLQCTKHQWERHHKGISDCLSGQHEFCQWKLFSLHYPQTLYYQLNYRPSEGKLWLKSIRPPLTGPSFGKSFFVTFSLPFSSSQQ